MKKVILSILVIVGIGVFYGFYIYNKKVPSLENATPDYTLTADELFSSFSSDEANAMKTYEGKVIQVSGNVLSVTPTDSISNVVLSAKDALFGGINCSFNNLENAPTKGQNITLKCQCQGYLTNVILNNCVPVK